MIIAARHVADGDGHEQQQGRVDDVGTTTAAI
jgi:hypothetical protein